jgi:ADP-ribose pyrophosphatase YjhB (NUDIX family)
LWENSDPDLRVLNQNLNYCQRCGGGLTEREFEARTRPCCEVCGTIVFVDPKIAAVVLLTLDDKLVLVKRGVEPALGEWAFPSGYVDRGERVEDAAVREVLEETGLDVRLDGLIGLYSRTGAPVVLAVYSATTVGGTLSAGHDAVDVGLFALDDLPRLPFPHDAEILRDWSAFSG